MVRLTVPGPKFAAAPAAQELLGLVGIEKGTPPKFWLPVGNVLPFYDQEIVRAYIRPGLVRQAADINGDLAGARRGGGGKCKGNDRACETGISFHSTDPPVVEIEKGTPPKFWLPVGNVLPTGNQN